MPGLRKARCPRCKPHGQPRLVPVTAPVIVDPRSAGKLADAFRRPPAELVKKRWKVYQAAHRRPHPGEANGGMGAARSPWCGRSGSANSYLWEMRWRRRCETR